jgi:hypothetical protein
MNEPTHEATVERVADTLLNEYETSCKANGTAGRMAPTMNRRHIRRGVSVYGDMVRRRKITIVTTDEQAVKMLPVWLGWFLGRRLLMWLVRRLAEEFFLRDHNATATH